MYGVDQYRDVVRVYALMYAVAEIEHQSGRAPVVFQYRCDLLPDARRGRVKHRGIHITLQGNLITDPGTGFTDVRCPVNTQGITTALRYQFQPLPAVFGK